MIDRHVGRETSPIGLHRVLDQDPVLPQAAHRLDTDPRIRADEVRVRVERLNLDAASYRRLHTAHDGDPDAIRREVLAIIDDRGKMHNPVTGSGGMLVGVVDEAGPASPLGLAPGDRIATLVSLTLTPLEITDGLARWDGRGEQIPAEGHAILFARSIAAVLPDDLPVPLSLAVMDVCGAPALTERTVARAARAGAAPRVAVLGAAGKSGSLSLAAARRAGAERVIGLVPGRDEQELLEHAGLADEVVRADARDPLAVAAAIGEPADITVVCVDVPGCEHGAILATAPGGTVIFFSMATSFSAAALGAEGLAADVTMLIGNGYVPGHADLALDLMRSQPALRELFTARLGGEPALIGAAGRAAGRESDRETGRAADGKGDDT
jgi:L-erythro-3,5-diaminohexanoate dehydrogenase